MKKYTEKTIKYYNAVADNYIKGNATVVLNDKIGRFVSLLPGKKILDIACGPGHDVDNFVAMGFDCLGIDLSEKMIELARKNFKGKFEIMDFFDLKLADDSFDGLWCSSIFVHIKKKDVPEVLKNSKKILKKNGVLGIITAHKYERIAKQNDTREYTMFEKKELENFLIEAEFEILVSEIFPYGGKDRVFMIGKKIIN